ncbi:AbgT family transporter [Ammoniphilus sp. CFH 90114]|uniref:AbgT family transporter n=1 Tax=Ammoniphilus sp. CFH 90114 TaxID=2493665 RepID=UPI00100DE850|nr:AbgT family transporter [Ammoniphilus sp. CFH 90114]RXT04342.1 AbgT family transporter [Ammoniphilus sp. CFH 90114]
MSLETNKTKPPKNLQPNAPEKKSLFNRMLDVVEKVGNKLPDPVTLFIIFAIIVLIASYFAAKAGVQVVHPSTGEPVKAVSLLSEQGLRDIMTKMVKNFAEFPPLGLVLVTMIGVGVAEGVGLISALLKKVVLGAPKSMITISIVFAGILANAAGDAGFIVLPPIAALVFMSVGRHPIAGMVAAYAAVAGGFSANLIVNMLDALLAGFTQGAAQIVDPNFIANPAMNWYFLAASSFIIIPLAVWITDKIVEPRLPEYTGPKMKLDKLTADENRGLKWAGIAALAFIALIALTIVPSDGPLRGEGGAVIISPFMSSLVPIIMGLFLFPAIAYGICTKGIRSDKDVADAMAKAMSGMGMYIILAFFAAQFIAYFNWSNLGVIMAISGADFLKSIGLTGLPLLIGFIIISAILNLFIGSASAKWAILGPVFVPMFMLLGYDPAFTQLAYRIGDSITNPITPMFAYFAILLALAKTYDKKMGLGSLIAVMLPYTLIFGVAWILFFVVWFFLGLPLGPGSGIFLP